LPDGWPHLAVRAFFVEGMSNEKLIWGVDFASILWGLGCGFPFVLGELGLWSRVFRVGS